MDEMIQVVKKELDKICALNLVAVEIPDHLVNKDLFFFTVRLKRGNVQQDIAFSLKELTQLQRDGLLTGALKQTVARFEKSATQLIFSRG